MSIETDVFRSLIHRRAMVGVLHSVIDGSLSAARFAEQFPRERLLDVLPALRRVEVERRLAEVAFGAEFTVGLREAPSVNCLEIVHPRLVITAVSRTNWVNWVEPYQRRQTLAMESQLSLFSDNSHDMSQRLYALLVYGSSGLGAMPDQARIVFPTARGHFAAGEIDLLAELPEVVTFYQPAEAPVVRPEVHLKPTARRVASDLPPDEA